MDFQGGKHLTFHLGHEEYAIPIHRVKEIIGMMEITTIPKTPHYFKGIINLRGKVIPIIDLRIKFAMESLDYSERTCIIILEVNNISRSQLMGIVVDSVSEVANIQQSDAEEPPVSDGYIDGRFLAGIAKVKERVLLLLEVEEILAREEIHVFKDDKGVNIDVE